MTDVDSLISRGKHLKTVQQELYEVSFSNYKVWSIYLKLIRNKNVDWNKYDLAEHESTRLLSGKCIKQLGKEIERRLKKYGCLKTH